MSGDIWTLSDRIGRAWWWFAKTHRTKPTWINVSLADEAMLRLHPGFGIPALGGWPTVMGMRLVGNACLMSGSVIVGTNDAVCGIGPGV